MYRAEDINRDQSYFLFTVTPEELKFLRLNLTYGHKCRKSLFNNKGFIVGSLEYKDCVLRKGKIDG